MATPPIPVLELVSRQDTSDTSGLELVRASTLGHVESEDNTSTKGNEFGFKVDTMCDEPRGHPSTTA
eukprot:9486171-Lingulodinium_polyedra.AAC.1